MQFICYTGDTKDSNRAVYTLVSVWISEVDRTAVDDQIKYLKGANKIVDSYIESLGAKKSELQGDQAQTHYTRLQTEFEQAFPDYKLGYVIGNSVYGLVNLKL